MSAAAQKIEPAPKPVAVPNVSPVAAPAPAPAPRRKRRLLRVALLLLGPVVLLIGGAYFYVTGARFVSTDNAYVKADIAAISPEVSGRVVTVAVANNDPVKAGQLLFRLDDQPFKLALAQAEAQLKTTRDDILAQQASYRQKKVEIEMAQQNIDFYQRELVIYDKMSKNNLVAQTQVDEAHHNLMVAQQQLPALQQELVGAAGQAPAQADEAGGMPLQQLPVNAGLVVEALQVGEAGELDQVVVAGLVGGDEGEVIEFLGASGVVAVAAVAGGEVALVAEQGLEARRLHGVMELHRAEHVAVVGDGHGRHAEPLGLLGHLVNAAGPVQQAELRMDVQVAEFGGSHGNPQIGAGLSRESPLRGLDAL